MKILFISQSPINGSVSIGNTFLNIFEDIENIEGRSGIPKVHSVLLRLVTNK